VELIPHDLLRLQYARDIISYSPQPDWVIPSLERVPFVVIRRVPLMKDMVPVGIRGEERNQRFAAFLPYDKIIERITPEQLVAKKRWRNNERIHLIKAMGSLPKVDRLFSKYGMAWGPTGSVGFELASGVPAAKTTSDLDIVARVPDFLPIETANQICDELRTIPVRVDVQLEVPNGVISLLEYGRGTDPILLRTKNGPRLTANPWLESR
jgi:phosphoribosyl-dephospho-CoA transferase